MAKLSAKNRKKVAKSEAVTGSFEPLAPGKYVANLREVEAKMSNNGNPMWAIQFDKIHNLDGESQPGRQFYNLMMPIDKMPEDYAKGEEKWEQYQALTAGRIKAFFEAFGTDEDADTDDLIGEKVCLVIGISTIQAGPRKGEKTNRVNAVLHIDEAGDVEIEDDEDDEDKF